MKFHFSSCINMAHLLLTVLDTKNGFTATLGEKACDVTTKNVDTISFIFSLRI